MYREGIVKELDLDTGRAKVRFPDRGDVESPWLSVLQRNVGGNKDQWWPEVDEFVAVLLDEHEGTGCLLGALYTTENKPEDANEDVRRVTFSDGTVVEYDRSAHKLTITVSGGDFELTADHVNVGAELKVAGGGGKLARADKVSQALSTLKSAISSAPTVPQDGGSSFKAALVGALSSWPPNIEAAKASSD